MSFYRIFYRVISIALLISFLACNSTPVFNVQEANEYNFLFSTKTGWTGADGAYSIALSKDKLLWLYGDTWVGKIIDNRHVEATLINNSVAIQLGINPSNASVNFFFGNTSEGKPDAFIKPSDGKGWFWMYHGLMTEKGLYLFLIQITRTADNPLGFKIIGTWLGHVLNPGKLPDEWQIIQKKIPWGRYSPAGDIIFGSSLLQYGNYIYIYGTSEDIKSGNHHKYMILARVPFGFISDFARWRFFSNGRWVNDFSKISRICGGMANEYSVSYLPILDKYITVYTENSVSENIVVRLAPEPHGPWSNPISIFKCPEICWEEGIFCYAAKGHPLLSTASDELIVSYVANSNDFWKMAADARLYRPRFLRIKFSESFISLAGK